MAALLGSDVEPAPFQAHRLTAQMLKEADLVLSMTRAQRGLSLSYGRRPLAEHLRCESCPTAELGESIGCPSGWNAGDKIYCCCRSEQERVASGDIGDPFD